MESNLSLLVKPVSADCNMGCAYCFYQRAGDPYLLEGRHIMEDMTLRTMIARYMKTARKGAAFGWQGGEPLLAGLEFFQKVVAYQQRYGLSGQLVSNNLQTNGTLLNDSWARFFRKYNFFVGVSLDGPQALHDHYRAFRNGRDSFNQAIQGIKTLSNHQVEFSILAVVNNLTAARPVEIYNYFVGNGLHRLQFIPCVEIDGDSGKFKDYSVGCEDYGRFLCSLFDAWYNKGEPFVSIRLFENVLALYMGIEPETCDFKDQCGSYVVIEYNGDVYPCDFFVEDKWRLGNIRSQPLAAIVNSERAKQFNKGKMQANRCSACDWNHLCHWGCQHYRQVSGENLLCDAYRKFFAYADERFRLLKAKFSKGSLS